MVCFNFAVSLPNFRFPLLLVGTSFFFLSASVPLLASIQAAKMSHVRLNCFLFNADSGILKVEPRLQLAYLRRHSDGANGAMEICLAFTALKQPANEIGTYHWTRSMTLPELEGVTVKKHSVSRFVNTKRDNATLSGTFRHRHRKLLLRVGVIVKMAKCESAT